MKLRALLWAAATLLIVLAIASNVDALSAKKDGYHMIDSNSAGGPAYNWKDISGTGTQVILTDDLDGVKPNSDILPIGFQFDFFGVSKTQFRVSNNGALMFTGTDPGNTFPLSSAGRDYTIPSGAQPNDFIAGYFGNLKPGQIYYQTDGSIGNRVLTVQYVNFDTTFVNCAPAPLWEFEFKLFEIDDSIEVHYKSANPTPTPCGRLWLAGGIENAAGNKGIDYTGVNGVLTGKAVRYWPNRAPAITGPASVTVLEDADVDIVLSGSDPDGDSITYYTTQAPSDGTLTSPFPSGKYKPNADFAGSDTIKITGKDWWEDGNTLTIPITVTPVNDAPSFTPGSNIEATPGGSTNTFTGWATDLEKGGGADEASQVLTFDLTPDTASLFATQPTIDGSGALSFKPKPEAVGSTDVTVVLRDNGGTANGGVDATMPVTFRITIPNGANMEPTANDQELATDEDTPLDLLLTGSDPEGEPLTFAIATPPTKGSFVGTAPTLTYVPDADAFGADSFAFTVNDGELSATGTIALTIHPVNDAPTASDVSAVTAVDTPRTITRASLLAGAMDVDGDILSITAIGTPSDGGSIAPSGSDWVYTPATSYLGSETITFEVSDGSLTAQALLTVTVTGALTPPDADFTFSSPLGEFTTGEDIAFADASTPGAGTITSYTWDFAGTPGSGSTATHAFATKDAFTVTLTVMDENGLSDSVSKVVDVTNSPPVAAIVVPDEMRAGDAFTLYDASTDESGVTRQWQDGSTGASVTLSFPGSGTFPFSLTVTDDAGAQDSITVQLTVYSSGAATTGGGGTTNSVGLRNYGVVHEPAAPAVEEEVQETQSSEPTTQPAAEPLPAVYQREATAASEVPWVMIGSVLSSLAVLGITGAIIWVRRSV